MSEGLPKGWVSANLTDVVSFALGGDWGKDPGELTDGIVRVRVVRGTEFKNWQKDKGVSAAERCIKISSLEKRRLQKNDLVLEVSGGGPQQPVGRTVLIDDEALKRADAPLVCSNFFRMLRLHDEINVSFVSHFLDYAYSLGKFNEFQTETTNLRNLNVPDFLSQTNVPLAPLAEQKRIVAKLEKVLEKVDASRARLDKIPTLLKRFRQSVLAAACSGKLTADWREKDGGNSVSEDDLPASWTSCFLKEVASVVSGFAFSSRDFTDAGVPAVKISNVQYGEFIEKNQEYLPEDFLKQYPSFVVFPQTLLMALTRPITNDTLKVCLYPTDAKPGLLNQRVCKLEPSSRVSRDYLHLFMQTKPFKTQVEENLSETLQPNLSPKALDKFSIALPPLSEQQEIVKRVEELFALADQLEARYAKAKAQVDRLTQSILAKAFRGELVPQNPTDEPASILLARLRSATPASKVRKKRAQSKE